MKITREEAQRRLNSGRNIADLSKRATAISPPQVVVNTPPPEDSIEHRTIDHRQRLGVKDTPEPIRDLMAELVHSGSHASAVARAFEVSNDVAERAASGRVGGMPATLERAEKVQMRKLEIQDRALLKLMQSLDLIDTDNLSELGPKDLASVASSLSKVSSSMEDGNRSGGFTANVVVYAPERKSEDKYKVVDV